MKKYLLSNYRLHAIEGSLFFGGMCFVSFETVLPQIVKSLGGTTWMVAIAPSLLVVGCALPSLFTAGPLARQPLKMPALKVSGIFQRLPFFLAGLVLLAAPWLPRPLVIGAVLAAPFCSGLACGATLPAWFDLVARTVPGQRITALFALRFAIGAVSGMAIGGVVEILLRRWPNPFGYSLLFFCTALLLFASYYFFVQIREPAPPKTPLSPAAINTDTGSYREIFADRDLIRFILIRFFACGIFIAVPFIPIQALKQLQWPESRLGFFVIAVIAGAVCGNLFASRWSRRHSCRNGLGLSGTVYLLTLTLAWFIDHPATVLAAFFALGFARDSWNSFASTLIAALPPRRLRMKSIALITTCYAPGLILAGLTGAGLWSLSQSYHLLLLGAALTQFAALALIRRMPRI